ncbi:MAG: fatty acid desaturase [Bacteroidota bacterium]
MQKEVKREFTKMEREILESLKNWQQIIRRYQTPSVPKAVRQLLNTFIPFIGFWVLMYLSLDWSIWITLALGVINGLITARIFIIQHDCGHQSFFKSKKLNNIVGIVCSFFSTLPYKYWAKVHAFHHGHTQQLEFRDIGDIPTLTVNEFREASRWRRFRYRVFRNPFILFFISPLAYVIISNRFPFVNMKGWKGTGRAQLINNILIIAVYATLAYLLGWKKFLLIQFFIVAIFSIVAFWFFYVQHQHEEAYKQWRKDWVFLLAAIRGSTYYKLPKIMNWFTGNIAFHHIHHLSPRIPNYNLEKCAQENPVLQKYVTAINFRESLKYAMNKLWDEESQRMITFREYYRNERLRIAA